tara:strand:+ start:882 stop:1778 length:897 start_codon:yes stop_codon:yes gene_type:complete
MAKVDKWGDPRTWSEEDKQKLHQQSEQLVDSEYMNEIMGQLDESQRFGGKYGILAALGYGNPDDRADIRNYQRITGGLPSVMGAYYQRKAANMPIEERRKQDAGEYNSSELQFFDSTAGDPIPGETIRVVYPTGASGTERKFRQNNLLTERLNISDRNKKRDPMLGYADTVQHELTHRGFENPVVRDALETHTKGALRTREDANQANRILSKLNSAGYQHGYIDATAPESPDNPEVQNWRSDAEYINEVLREFLADPETAEEYNAYIPTPEAQRRTPEEPSIVDTILELLTGKQNNGY